MRGMGVALREYGPGNTVYMDGKKYQVIGLDFYRSSIPDLNQAHKSWGNCTYVTSGIDLYREPLRKMFEAPIQLAMPNLMLPAFNDSTEAPVRNNLYELAFARYHDTLYLTALVGASRRNEYGLWFGVDRIPAGEPAPLKSRNAGDSGYAILQRGVGQQATWLCLKYGPHGGNSAPLQWHHFAFRCGRRCSGPQ
jgi:hypothetical protein